MTKPGENAARQVGEIVRGALDLAAREVTPGTPIETGRLFLALARVDAREDWSRVWQEVGYPAPGTFVSNHDPDGRPAEANWSGVALSAAAARALARAAHLAATHGMPAITPGVLAVALVLEPGSAAAVSLLSRREVGHSRLLEVVQDELLGDRLDGLDRPVETTITPAADDPSLWCLRAAMHAGSRDPDDLDLLGVLAAHGEIGASSNGSLIVPALEQAADAARSLGTATLDSVVRAAKVEFGTATPGAEQLLFAMTDRPSAAMKGILSVIGLSPKQLAAGAAEHGEPSGRTKVGGRVFAWTLVNLVFLLATIALVVQDIARNANWWELVLLLAVFYGPPAVSSWFSGAVSVVLAVVNPWAALTMAAHSLLGWFQERAERQALTARTGVRLTPAEYRGWVKRRRYTAKQLARNDRMRLPRRVAVLVRSAAAGARA
ncbi:hypothetical protein [Amycolatopsis sp. NPDC051371]|uniref:hypothetical protein n=1 Tax=Amycolatopsis sp. NPDC051371 TaxID=3155800 RepID=UPI0034342BA9